MNKFENGKIYKITDNTTNMIYVGSTCKTLKQRLKGHEYVFKCFKAGKYPNNVTVFKILENNNYKIELIKLYPCKNKQELNIEEGKTIQQFRNDKLNIVNRNISGITHKESVCQYFQRNKTLIVEKARHKHICQCKGKYTNSGKAQHEKSKKHQDYMNNSKTINIETLNVNITVNNIQDLEKVLKTINK